MELLYNRFPDPESALAALPTLSNPAELADTLTYLVSHKYPPARLAQLINKSTSDVRQLLVIGRRATATVKMRLNAGRIRIGHARALARMPPQDQDQYVGDVIARRRSVREVEARAKGKHELADYLNKLAEELSVSTEYPVTIELERGKNDTGYLKIRFTSLEEFEAIAEKLGHKFPRDDEVFDRY